LSTQLTVLNQRRIVVVRQEFKFDRKLLPLIPDGRQVTSRDQVGKAFDFLDDTISGISDKPYVSFLILSFCAHDFIDRAQPDQQVDFVNPILIDLLTK